MFLLSFVAGTSLKGSLLARPTLLFRLTYCEMVSGVAGAADFPTLSFKAIYSLKDEASAGGDDR